MRRGCDRSCDMIAPAPAPVSLATQHHLGDEDQANERLAQMCAEVAQIISSLPGGGISLAKMYKYIVYYKK